MTDEQAAEAILILRQLTDACNWDDVLEVGGKPLRTIYERATSFLLELEMGGSPEGEQ